MAEIITKVESDNCPICGTAKDWEKPEINDEFVDYPWECKHCGTKGVDIYAMEFVETEFEARKIRISELEAEDLVYNIRNCMLSGDMDNAKKLLSQYVDIEKKD